MTIIDDAKEIATLIQKLGDIELYRKIVELEGSLIELTREKRELESRLEDLQRDAAIIDDLVFDSPFYRTVDGAVLFCARCIEKDRRAIHVSDTGNSNRRRHIWKCPECNSEYTDMRRTNP